MTKDTADVSETQPSTEKSGPGCLALTLLLIGLAILTGFAIYLMILFGGATING